MDVKKIESLAKLMKETGLTGLELVEEGQQEEVTERSPNTNLFTYVVEPAVAMSGIYKTSERIHARQGVIKEIQHTDRGYYLIVEFDE